jgi:hypothetical protein
MEKLKSLNVGKCPHCSGQILVEFENSIPNVTNIFTEGDVENAKTQVLTAIKNMDNLSDEDKKNAEDWINRDDVIFGPGEIKDVIKSIMDAEEKH